MKYVYIDVNTFHSSTRMYATKKSDRQKKNFFYGNNNINMTEQIKTHVSTYLLLLKKKRTK